MSSAGSTPSQYKVHRLDKVSTESMQQAKAPARSFRRRNMYWTYERVDKRDLAFSSIQTETLPLLPIKSEIPISDVLRCSQVPNPEESTVVKSNPLDFAHLTTSRSSIFSGASRFLLRGFGLCFFSFFIIPLLSAACMLFFISLLSIISTKLFGS